MPLSWAILLEGYVAAAALSEFVMLQRYMGPISLRTMILLAVQRDGGLNALLSATVRSD